MAQRDAMKDYVEATDRVTGILVRLGAGEAVESEEIEDARRQELVATSRYIGSLVKLGASAVAEALSDGGGGSEGEN
jgi:hypothetical protein